MDMGNINAIILEADARMLHLTYHRNKNQHRLAKWWKWLSMLRRCVAKLLLDLQSDDEHRASCRAKHLQEILLPRCYLSFSQVVADGQFVALGLVLLGLLARIGALVALPETPEHDGKRGRGMGAEAAMEVEDIGDAEDLGRPVLRPTASLGASNLGRAEGREKQDDLAGVDEDRDSICGTAITGFQPHRAGTTSASRQKAVKKKKGATGRNAIDNLFSGIG